MIFEKFIGHYGCSVDDNYVVPLIGTKYDVEEYLYQQSIEVFESFAGLHGLLSFEEFCEELDGFETEFSAEELYDEYREGELCWYAEPFDETLEDHMDILTQEGGKFIEV